MNIPADQYELYAEFGIAAEKAQVFEVDAGNVALSFLALFVDTDQISTEQRDMFQKLTDDVDRKTLGRLLRLIKSVITIDQTILRVVDEALEQRNYLTHKFFRNHNFALFDVAGRKAMIDELKHIQSKLDVAHWMLHGLSETLTMLAGRDALDVNLVKQLTARGKRVKI
jgi:hypothetical protein